MRRDSSSWESGDDSEGGSEWTRVRRRCSPKTPSAGLSMALSSKSSRTRSISASNLVDVMENEKRHRNQQPDEPVHHSCDSFLSWSSNHTDYSGLANWAMTLLFLGGARLCLENVLKYGILVDPPQWFIALNGGSFSLFDRHPSWLTLAYLLVPAGVALLVEQLMAKLAVSWPVGVSLHALNITIVLLVPVAVSALVEDIPFIGMVVISFACVILSLKLFSFVHVNKWCRDHHSGRKRSRSLSFTSTTLQYESVAESTAGRPRHKQAAPRSSAIVRLRRPTLRYPHNLSAANLLYFLAAPTLCYELNFPRSERVRMWFVCRRVLELIIGVNVQVALFQQWMVPCVQNSVETFSKMHLTRAMERIMKLAIPNHLLWIMTFYLTFHSLFNLVAELLRFGDRRFYQDWWNSQDIETFWRAWNVPVHKFAMRHLYLPMLRHRFSRRVASITVFVVSAFFHEYLVMIPLRITRAWAFIAMVTQIPLSYVTSLVRCHVSERLSNIIVWLSVIMGQPLAIMMYYHEYIIEFHSSLLLH